MNGMRNSNAFRKRRKVVIKNFYRFSGINLTITKQITDGFLFFGIHAHYRIPRSIIHSSQFSNTLKLGITIDMPASRLFFQGLTFYIIAIFQ